MEYPEHEKLAKVKDESQAIGEFLEWLENHGEYELGAVAEDLKLYPLGKSIERILAEYFKVDQRKLEAEKQTMLEAIRVNDLGSRGGNEAGKGQD